MAEHSLLNREVLAVGDGYMLAEEFCRELEERGAVVIGPFATIDGAIAAILTETEIDAAVLDANLAAKIAHPDGELLLKGRIPLVFDTRIRHSRHGRALQKSQTVKKTNRCNSVEPQIGQERSSIRSGQSRYLPCLPLQRASLRGRPHRTAW